MNCSQVFYEFSQQPCAIHSKVTGHLQICYRIRSFWTKCTGQKYLLRNNYELYDDLTFWTSSCTFIKDHRQLVDQCAIDARFPWIHQSAECLVRLIQMLRRRNASCGHQNGHGPTAIRRLYRTKYGGAALSRTAISQWVTYYEERGTHAHRGGNGRPSIRDAKKHRSNNCSMISLSVLCVL